MIYHTNPGNCHTDKIARAGARQARAWGGCWLPGYQQGWRGGLFLLFLFLFFMWVPLPAYQEM